MRRQKWLSLSFLFLISCTNSTDYRSYDSYEEAIVKMWDTLLANRKDETAPNFVLAINKTYQQDESISHINFLKPVEFYLDTITLVKRINNLKLIYKKNIICNSNQLSDSSTIYRIVDVFRDAETKKYFTIIDFGIRDSNGVELKAVWVEEASYF